MAEITETEVVAGKLRRIALGDAVVRVPATPTLRYMFWMRRFNKQFAEAQLTDEDIADCYEQTVEFLDRYNPDLDREKIESSCELIDLVTFYSRCFGADAETGEGDERPPRPTRGGRSTSRKPSRSRS